MLMLFRHPTRQALPVKEPLNGRLEARALSQNWTRPRGWGHIDLDHRNGMEMRPTAQPRLRHALNRPRNYSVTLLRA